MPPLLAVQFLTRIPVPGLQHLTASTVREGLRKSVVWFPAVGGMVGVVTAAILFVTEQYWPRTIAVILALIAEARLTGAFHEDAVADFCDGFGGGHSVERISEIMKDSRIGSYGTLGLLLAVALRGACLTAAPETLLLPLVIASATAGRWGAVLVMALVPPVPQSSGLAKDIGQQVSGAALLFATLLLVPFTAGLLLMVPMAAAAALGAQVAASLWFRPLLLKRLGGVTGDCLGFFVYLSQLIWLLVVLAWVH